MTKHFLIFITVFISALSFSFSGEASNKIRLKNITLDTAVLRTMARPFRRSHELFILQFKGPVKNETKAFLKDNGVEIGSYIPDYAFLARVNSEKSWEAIDRSSEVKAVVPYLSVYKRSQDLKPSSVFTRQTVQKVLVKLFNQDTVKRFVDFVESNELNLQLTQVSSSTLAAEGLVSDLDRMAEFGGVEFVSPFPVFKTMEYDPGVEFGMVGGGVLSGNIPLTGFETGTKIMNFEAAWNRGFDGSGEIGGIADTGLDQGSTGRIVNDFKGRIIRGYALGIGAKGWYDPNGHGTHCAGSITGDGAMSGGILKGGASGAHLVAQGMWSPWMGKGGGLMVPMPLDKLYGKQRHNDGVTIHSNSWGSPQNPGGYSDIAATVDELMFKYPELLLVFAAGNSGTDKNGDGKIDPTSIGAPATAKNVLSVGASKNFILEGGRQKTMKELNAKSWPAEPLASSRLSDNPNGMAAFSSVGPTKDGRIKPDVVAPGSNIVSTRSTYKGANKGWADYDNNYVFASGTSMATPLTAGAALVARQFLKTRGLNNPTGALIKAMLIHSAHDMFPGQFGTGQFQEMPTKRPNSIEGYGRVDADKATSFAAEDQIIDHTTGLGTGEAETYTVAAKQGDHVIVTLAYTDAPGASSAARALVNDLDVSVSGGGQSFYPNHLSGPDRLNNVEMVEFTAPQDGNYEVRLNAHNVPKGQAGTGKQPFALIITN